MRIVCHSVQDFLRNLEGESVYLQTIHVDFSQRELSEVSQEIVIQASAVLDKPGGGQALLQCGEICGIDRRDAPAGSAAREEFKRQIQRFCDERALRIKPGILDM